MSVLIRIGESRGSLRESVGGVSVWREFMRHLFVVDSLDKQIQNEKELIHLASAGGGAILYLCGEY